MNDKGSYSPKMLCGSSRYCLLLSSFIVTLASNAVEAGPQSTSATISCPSQATTGPVIYTASNGSLSTYEGPPQLTTTELNYGNIVHWTIYTLVASQIPQYAISPGTLTVISTTNTWGQETTETVAPNGWGMYHLKSTMVTLCYSQCAIR